MPPRTRSRWSQPSSSDQTGRTRSATHRACSRRRTDRTRPTPSPTSQGNALEEERRPLASSRSPSARAILTRQRPPFSRTEADPRGEFRHLKRHHVKRTRGTLSRAFDRCPAVVALGCGMPHSLGLSWVCPRSTHRRSLPPAGAAELRDLAARFTTGKPLMMHGIHPRILLFVITAAAHADRAQQSADEPQQSAAVLTGHDALGDWTTDSPGLRRRITIDDLAKPFETPSANNFPEARAAACRCHAACAQGLSGVGVRPRHAKPSQDCHRSQRRPVRRREHGQPDQDPARRRLATAKPS